MRFICRKTTTAPKVSTRATEERKPVSTSRRPQPARATPRFHGPIQRCHTRAVYLMRTHLVVRGRDALENLQALERGLALGRFVRQHTADRAPEDLRRGAVVNRAELRVGVRPLAEEGSVLHCARRQGTQNVRARPRTTEPACPRPTRACCLSAAPAPAHRAPAPAAHVQPPPRRPATKPPGRQRRRWCCSTA